jgi:hypothetical protein
MFCFWQVVRSVALTITNPKNQAVTIDLNRMISRGAGESISFCCNQSKITLNAQQSAELQVRATAMLPAVVFVLMEFFFSSD